MSTRVDWVDTAKGICIIFVVMLHAVSGVQEHYDATGWMNPIIEFAQPFRMPDFFLISGLFLANVINRDWRLYLDRKVIHFVYFYVLWMSLQIGIKSPLFAQDFGGWMGVAQFYAESFVVPLGTLWFIYMLPIFFVVCKLAHEKRIPWQVMLVGAVMMNVLQVQTGWFLFDQFTSRFVYFYIGYVFAGQIFEIADWARNHLSASAAYLIGWAGLNGALVYSGLASEAGIELVLGVLGAGAIILTSTLIVRANWLPFLKHFGANSIVIYLAFFFPLGVMRQLLFHFGHLDIGTTSLIITVISVVTPMILFWAIQKTGHGQFLFKRPSWAYLDGTRPTTYRAVPAE